MTLRSAPAGAIALCAAFFASLCGIPRIAEAQEDILVVTLRYRHTVAPRSLPSIVDVPLTSTEGKTKLPLLGSFFGRSPDDVAAANAQATGFKQEHTPKGETVWGEMAIPPGYVYCATVRYGKQSQTNNARMRLFLSKDERKVEWNSYAKSEGVFEGRNWVNRDFDIIFVKADSKNKEKCITPEKDRQGRHVIFEARGRNFTFDSTVRVHYPND